MKTINSLLLLFVLGSMFTSCVKDDPIIVVKAETLTVSNLHAPSDVRDLSTGEIIEANDFVYFDYSSGLTVEKTDDWDIAFKGTTLITNGGVNGTGNVSAAIVLNTFNEAVEAPANDQFNQDTDITNAIPSGSGNGWYNYNPANHLISPIPGRIFIIKTTEGNYAKMEILSYYKDAPIGPDPAVDSADYFTFNYAYQKSGSKTF